MPADQLSREVDAVAIDAEGQVLGLGSWKWTSGEMESAEKALLEHSPRHCPRRRGARLLLLLPSGFSAEPQPPHRLTGAAIGTSRSAFHLIPHAARGAATEVAWKAHLGGELWTSAASAST